MTPEDMGAKIAYWNHRITRQVVGDETVFAIREVYYGAEDEVLGWTEDAVGPHGESYTEIVADLARMIACMNKPVFDIDTRTEIPVLKQDTPQGDDHG